LREPHGAHGLAAAALVAAVMPACAHQAPPVAVTGQLKALASLTREISYQGQRRLERTMDPATLTLARRLEPERQPDLWGRAEGWASLDVSVPPDLGLGRLGPEDAQRINAYLPMAGDPPPAAAPFYLRRAGPDRDRALYCLTQAIYYEAALEPEVGQEAVAQTVLNRVRHPAFPKSVCGVVFQGSQQVTGCQFSFTCDGSRDRAPEPGYWAKAKAVAERALDGFVLRRVGTATHYHADYVFPRWGPTLVKITQFGRHIFYRFPGPAGQTDSFDGRYQGRELAVSLAGPPRAAILAAKAAADAGLAPIEAFTNVDPTTPTGLRKRVAGQVLFGRRAPTPEEIAAINRSLAAIEKDAPPILTVPSPPGATVASPPASAAPEPAPAKGRKPPAKPPAGKPAATPPVEIAPATPPI
jgi:spore germination cell wall hydrolase CwlJ-like protein